MPPMSTNRVPVPPAQDATPEDILSSVVFELDNNEELTPQALGKNKIVKAAPLSSDVIISIMLYDPDSRTRLQAAKMILDRVYGTGTNSKPLADENKSLYNDVFEKITAGLDIT